MTNNLKGVLFALLAFASYSLMDALVKYVGMVTQIDWKILIFNVSVLVLITLFLVILLSKNSTFKINNPYWLFVRALIGATNLHIVFFILPKVNLNLFYSLVFITPIIASILAIPILGEKMNIHKLISIIAGFIGILLITRPWGYFVNEQFSIIELVPLLVALFDATIGIIARKFLINDKPTTLVFYQFILSTIVSGIIVLYNYKTVMYITLGFPFLYNILLITLFTLGGYIFYIKAVQKAPVQMVLPMGYSQMVFGVIISILIFSQYPTVNIIIGSIIIILASLHMVLYTAKK